jgi:hypothetical protein
MQSKRLLSSAARASLFLHLLRAHTKIHPPYFLPTLFLVCATNIKTREERTEIRARDQIFHFFLGVEYILEIWRRRLF